MKTKSTGKKNVLLIITVVTAFAISLAAFGFYSYQNASVSVLEILGVNKYNTDNIESVTISDGNEEKALSGKEDIDFVIDSLEKLEFRREALPTPDGAFFEYGSLGGSAYSITFHFTDGVTRQMISKLSCFVEFMEVHNYIDPQMPYEFHALTRTEDWSNISLPKEMRNVVEHYFPPTQY